LSRLTPILSVILVGLQPSKFKNGDIIYIFLFFILYSPPCQTSASLKAANKATLSFTLINPEKIYFD
jgi:hypothetical protein